MALARDTTAANIKPLVGAITQRVQLGATVSAGEIITLQSDGKWDPTATTAAQLNVAIAVQGGADTDYVDAVTHGPINCVTGATIGALIYASDTAGEPSLTAGTKTTIVGYATSATVVYVQPQIDDLT